MSVELENLLGETAGLLSDAFDQMEWAEDEISRAQKRYPHKADELWHSFKLLRTDARIHAEFVYRAHCREILSRVVAGAPTQPGTAVEVIIMIQRISLATPINVAAFGLLARLWNATFPQHPEVFDKSEHYEAIRKEEIDDFERISREKLATADRVWAPPSCRGLHNGERANCRFALADAIDEAKQAA